MWLLVISDAQALDQISLGVEKIKGATWQLQKLRIVLGNLPDASPRLTLTADQLILPAPFDRLALINLRCPEFSLLKRQLECGNGSIKISSEDLQMSVANFSFLLSADKSYFRMRDLRIAKGRISIDGLDQNGRWQIKIAAQSLSPAQLQSLFKKTGFSLNKGRINVLLTLDGKATELNNAALTLHAQDITMQTADGRYAGEGVALDSYIKARQQKSRWSWQSHLAFSKGGLFIDPVYLEAPSKKAIELDSVGRWSETSAQWHFEHLQFNHPEVVNLAAQAGLAPTAKKWLKSAQVSFQTKNLQQLTGIYSAPFLVGSAFEGVTLTGNLAANVKLQEQAITALHLDIEHLGLSDPKQRLSLSEAGAILDWENQPDFKRTGFIKWRQLQFYSLPLETTQLNFGVTANSLELLQPIDIAFLGGTFAIRHFEWRSRPKQAPEVHFTGGLQKVSLAQLSKALDWTPLTGEISGDIPGISYQNHRVDLEGALHIQVFDGEITVNRLAAAKLLSDSPKFYSDIKIERLNLKQLTEKFKFGSIEGLLSGYIKDLYLENWQPVSFYAWLGTPEGDSTAHRISQKAVDNIAGIGGGGATDLISRSVLGIFDSFGYERLGLGCYLNAGVCQLMALERAKNGYYIVKGGGIPKIDVIGYNPKVDWKVLVQRLGRVSAPDNMIVE